MLYYEYVDGLAEEQVSELGDRLKQIQKEGVSLRDLEERSEIDGVPLASKSAIREVIKNPERKPRITTLLGIAMALQLPLWQVINMAGYDLGLPVTDDPLLKDLQALAQREPESKQLLDLLLAADPKDRQAVLNYLRVQAGGE